MGRRFLLILGMLLLVPPALRPARAQDGGGPPALDAAPAAPSELPAPEAARSAGDGRAAAAGRARRSRATPRARARKAKARARRCRPDASVPAGRGPSPAPAPPSIRSAGRPADLTAPRREPADATRPPGDRRACRRTDGPRPMTRDGLPAERLPAGKQSVAVTVDVQSPPNMNLHSRRPSAWSSATPAPPTRCRSASATSSPRA